MIGIKTRFQPCFNSYSSIKQQLKEQTKYKNTVIASTGKRIRKLPVPGKASKTKNSLYFSKSNKKPAIRTCRVAGFMQLINGAD